MATQNWTASGPPLLPRSLRWTSYSWTEARLQAAGDVRHVLGVGNHSSAKSAPGDDRPPRFGLVDTRARLRSGVLRDCATLVCLLSSSTACADTDLQVSNTLPSSGEDKYTERRALRFAIPLSRQHAVCPRERSTSQRLAIALLVTADMGEYSVKQLLRQRGKSPPRAHRRGTQQTLPSLTILCTPLMLDCGSFPLGRFTR